MPLVSCGFTGLLIHLFMRYYFSRMNPYKHVGWGFRCPALPLMYLLYILINQSLSESIFHHKCVNKE